MDEGPAQRVKYRFVYLIRHQHSGAWDQSPAERLSHYDNVRLYSVSLCCEERAGASHAGLYLIENKQRPVTLAESLHASEIVCWWRNDSRLSLNRLQDHGGDRFGRQQLFDGYQISKRNFVGSS